LIVKTGLKLANGFYLSMYWMYSSKKDTSSKKKLFKNKNAAGSAYLLLATHNSTVTDMLGIQ
jgi:hypothetical protein